MTELFTSDGSFSSMDDFIDTLNAGAGMLHVAGHGSPSVWGNFLPDAQEESEFVYGFTAFDIRRYSNGNMLPIIVCGGCHNAQFNVTMQHIFDHGGLNFTRAGFDEWLPHDTMSWFLLEKGGGSIASIGNTGLGYGYVGEYCIDGLGGWLNPRFFHAYASQHKEFLGEAHSQAIVDYIDRKGALIDGVNVDSVDRKSIEEWVLLGDPSMKIGGYGLGTLNQGDDDELDIMNPSTLGTIDTPIWEEGMQWTYAIEDIEVNLSEIAGRDQS